MSRSKGQPELFAFVVDLVTGDPLLVEQSTLWDDFDDDPETF